MKCYNYDIKEYYTWECYKLKKSQSITAIKWGLRGTKWQVLVITAEKHSDLVILDQRSMNINN